MLKDDLTQQWRKFTGADFDPRRSERAAGLIDKKRLERGQSWKVPAADGTSDGSRYGTAHQVPRQSQSTDVGL